MKISEKDMIDDYKIRQLCWLPSVIDHLTGSIEVNHVPFAALQPKSAGKNPLSK